MTTRISTGILFAALIVAGVLAGCADRLTGTVRANMAPKTTIWVDTLGVTQTSRVRLYWSGDDPDGFVKGFFVTVDTAWTFTTSQDSTFLIPLGGLDTLIARFRVAAVDNEGNGSWDSEVRAGSIVFGREPFTDLDGNGTWSTGEPFVDLGLADPDPPQLFIKIKNTPPVVAFTARTEVPASTLPAASFLINGSDLDGNETIERFWISLNQPDTTAPGWVELPATTSLFTIVGNLNEAGDTVTARVLLGTGLTDISVSVPGLRLGQNNVLYVYCRDLSGATSTVARMPDTSKTWFVRKPTALRRLLLVNDYGPASPDPEATYLAALAVADDGNGGTYNDAQVLNIVSNPIPAPIHKPMLIATMSLYKSVLWFGKVANFSYAQNSVPEYLASGGKVLFTSGFPTFDQLGLPIDFLPVDSLISSYSDSTGTTAGYISRVYQNSVVRSSDTTAFPTLVFAQTSVFGTFAVAPAPGNQVIYRLDPAKNPPNTLETWKGTPPVGVMSSQQNIMVLTVPLHLMNTTDGSGNNRLVRFMEGLFRDAFGI